MEYLPGQRRISLISKLLTLWKPQTFAMWDEFARRGLRRVHGSRRGHCYHEYSPAQYEIFCADFFGLFSRFEPELEAIGRKTDFVGNAKSFAPRILDNYLMLL